MFGFEPELWFAVDLWFAVVVAVVVVLVLVPVLLIAPHHISSADQSLYTNADPSPSQRSIPAQHHTVRPVADNVNQGKPSQTKVNQQPEPQKTTSELNNVPDDFDENLTLRLSTQRSGRGIPGTS